jgi:hypothetical protein
MILGQKAKPFDQMTKWVFIRMDRSEAKSSMLQPTFTIQSGSAFGLSARNGHQP